MNAGFERVVRDVISELADEGRAVNLSTAAIRQGRRIIVRRRIISAAAAVAAAAALAVPFVLVNDRPRALQPGSQPASTPSPARTAEPAPSPLAATDTSSPAPGATRPVVPIGKGVVKVGGGLVILAAPSSKGTWVLDRTRQLYRQIPYDRAYPAPAGDQVAVIDAGRVGIYNMRTSSIRWVTGKENVVGTFDWSEDGGRLLYPVNGTTSNTLRLGVLDVSTLRLKVLGKDIECYENCAPAWLPGGKEITLTDASTGAVRTYSAADGAPSGTLKLPGSIPALHSWSPDGTLVATRTSNQTVIIDDRTNAQILSLNERADCVYWISNSSLLVVREDGFTTYAINGDAREFVPMPSGVGEAEITATIVGSP